MNSMAILLLMSSTLLPLATAALVFYLKNRRPGHIEPVSLNKYEIAPMHGHNGERYKIVGPTSPKIIGRAKQVTVPITIGIRIPKK